MSRGASEVRGPKNFEGETVLECVAHGHAIAVCQIVEARSQWAGRDKAPTCLQGNRFTHRHCIAGLVNCAAADRAAEAGVADFAFYLAYTLTYLLVLNVAWRPHIPIYLEQCLIPLYMIGALGADYLIAGGRDRVPHCRPAMTDAAPPADGLLTYVAG